MGAFQMMFFAAAFTIVGALAVAAWLVAQGHPWFALLVIVVASGVSMSRTTK